MVPTLSCTAYIGPGISAHYLYNTRVFVCVLYYFRLETKYYYHTGSRGYFYWHIGPCVVCRSDYSYSFWDDNLKLISSKDYKNICLNSLELGDIFVLIHNKKLR